MNKTEIELFLHLVATEIDIQNVEMTYFRKEIFCILVFAFLWYALLFTYIEHQSDKRLEKIEKLLENKQAVVPVGYVQLGDAKQLAREQV